jgi:hypothetical protein
MPMRERRFRLRPGAAAALLLLARRSWPWMLALSLLVLVAVTHRATPGWLGSTTAVSSTPAAVRTLPALFDDLEERTFRFFWNTAQPVTGLVPDRYPTPSPASIAAVGFALTAYPIGAERGYVTRKEARQRVLKTLQALHDAPQGTGTTGTAGYQGFFYRFLDLQTGRRSGDIELSTVDTALLMGGVLFCESYFDGPDPEEAQIRNLADTIYRSVDWRWAQVRPPAISHGWTPEAGFLKYDWRGYNEAMLVYILALGSPTHPVARNAWGEPATRL